MDKISSIIITILVCCTIVYAAPAQESLALNPETKQCGTFWAGDEFARYTLKEGWITYDIGEEKTAGECIKGTGVCRGYQCKLNDMPESYCWGSKLLCDNVRCEGYTIETDQGTCYMTASAETCCAQLGYTYIEDNVGQRKLYLKGTWRNIMVNHPETMVLLVIGILAFIYLKRRYRLKT